MQERDLILTSKTIFTGTEDAPISGGVVIRDNKIVAVGSLDHIAPYMTSDAEVRDYGDKLIMPGMIDSHIHFFQAAFVNSEYGCPGLGEAKSKQDCLDIVSAFIEKHPDFPAYCGQGWHTLYWENPDEPLTRYDLDKLCPDKPIYLLEATWSRMWINSKGLEIHGITRDSTVDVGSIGFDADGEPDGVLYFIDAYGKPLAAGFRDTVKAEYILDMGHELNKWGITGVGDCPTWYKPCGNFAELAEAHKLEENGTLPLRLFIYPSLGIKPDYDDVVRLHAKYHSDMLCINGLKQYMDGNDLLHTAAMTFPYGDVPDDLGAPVFPEEVYYTCVREANKRGFSVKLHTIGDYALRAALNVFEASARVNDMTDIRNAVEHCFVVQPEELARFRKLNIVANMQPSILGVEMDMVGDWWAFGCYGEEIANNMFPLNSMLKAGCNLALGSDAPGSNPWNAFVQIYYAVTRKRLDGQCRTNLDERLTLSQTLRAYTYGSAYSMGKESVLGTLEPGKYADITVVDRNLFAVSPDELLETQAEMTMCNGKIVYEKNK